MVRVAGRDGNGRRARRWPQREDEPTQRVKTLVGAFFERSKLPKMLRRKELLDTVANGAEQGRFVLRLQRPDGSARTWWHERPDDAALAEANLEAVQPANAVLEMLPASLLRPGVLPGLDFAAGVKVADLLAYFAGGHVETVTQSVGGAEYEEAVPIPTCSEAKVLEAATAAVKAGHLWVTNGPMSYCGEEPPAGAVAKTATLRSPPAPVPLTTLTPEALPDGWSDGVATALSLLTAVSAKLAPPGVLPPWPVLCRAVNDALNSRFLEVVPDGPVPWPCEAQSAARVRFCLPAMAVATDNSTGGTGKNGSFAERAQSGIEPPIAAGRLDSADLIALAEALADVQAAVAGYGTPLVFKVSVEAAGLPPDARHALRSELAKATEAFRAAE
jgi:hypothetical protein